MRLKICLNPKCDRYLPLRKHTTMPRWRKMGSRFKTHFRLAEKPVELTPCSIKCQQIVHNRMMDGLFKDNKKKIIGVVK